LQRDAPPREPSFIHLSRSLVYKPPPRRISGFPTTKGPQQGGMPTFRDSLNISFRVPSDEAPPRPPTEPLQRERHFIHTLRSLVDEPPLQVPQNGAPMKRDACLQSLPTYFQGPQQGEPPLQVPFTELSQRETLHP
jgi:hypothetical protein